MREVMNLDKVEGKEIPSILELSIHLLLLFRNHENAVEFFSMS